MRLVEIHIHPVINDDKLDRILRKLDLIIKQQIQMANEINAYLDRIEKAFANITQDIQDIKDGLPATGGLTAAETAQVKARLSAVVKSAEDLDAQNTRPEVPEEPEPEA